ncbi:uncharacterized protein LOC131218510 isoform X2 [Magnolia sinica]|uniref:uncharacterized protein LOC131218510 isoform X2 n=1 Tax=Magnolia sinica TaxID=86752 RepID=UPI0026590451|nr:uncharacterized protein LOC131218510 isoform X2 [Magnolia sinica]
MTGQAVAETSQEHKPPKKPKKKKESMVLVNLLYSGLICEEKTSIMMPTLKCILLGSSNINPHSHLSHLHFQQKHTISFPLFAMGRSRHQAVEKGGICRILTLRAGENTDGSGWGE